MNFIKIFKIIKKVTGIVTQIQSKTKETPVATPTVISDLDEGSIASNKLGFTINAVSIASIFGTDDYILELYSESPVLAILVIISITVMNILPYLYSYFIRASKKKCLIENAG